MEGGMELGPVPTKLCKTARFQCKFVLLWLFTRRAPQCVGHFRSTSLRWPKISYDYSRVVYKQPTDRSTDGCPTHCGALQRCKMGSHRNYRPSHSLTEFPLGKVCLQNSCFSCVATPNAALLLRIAANDVTYLPFFTVARMKLVSGFFLVPNCQNDNRIGGALKTVERYIARIPKGYDEFAEFG